MKAFVPSGNSLKRTPPNERVEQDFGRNQQDDLEEDNLEDANTEALFEQK